MRKMLVAVATLLLLCVTLAAKQDESRAVPGLLRYAAVSQTQIAFCYGNHLWVAPREGGMATMLASPAGSVSFPRFSPDGKTIAFLGNYDGNHDIYTMPVDGGVPFRVTYHPTTELLCNWTADGKLLFFAYGMAGQGRMSRIYTVSPKGGMPTALPVPYGADAAISPDGAWLAYIPHTTDFSTWKRYRGGMATDIWLFNLKDHSSKKITDWEGTDTIPMWHGKTVYYLSDNGSNHRLNIWSYDTTNGHRRQSTNFDDYDVKWPSIGPGPEGKGEIVFQKGLGLFLLDLGTGKASEVHVTIPGARPSVRDKIRDVSGYISNWSVSPSAKRVAVEARGDIWTLPAKEGSPRNMTHTSGFAEREPSWSPDGRWIAYFSDKTGEYELYIAQSDGKGETKQLTKQGWPFKFGIVWSPDSKKIAFCEKDGTLYLLDVASGDVKKVDREPNGWPLGVSWSNDSNWLTYSRTSGTDTATRIYIYSVEKGESKCVTSGFFADRGPVFDRKGDYIYFASRRATSPVYDEWSYGFIYNNADVLMALPLRADIKSTWLPKSDEETWGDKKKVEEEKPQDNRPSAPPTGDRPRRGRRGGGGGSISTEVQGLEEVAVLADDVSGTWTGTVAGGEPIPAGGLPFTAHLTLAADNTVSGDVQSALGNITVSGKYDPTTKTLTLTGAAGTEAASVTLKISGNSMSGSVTVGGQVYQISAQRSGGAGGAPGGGAKPAEATKPPEKVKIDFDGMEAREIQLPLSAGNFAELAVNDKNQLIFARISGRRSNEGAAIKLFDITDDKREEQTVVAGAAQFDMTADGKKLLVIRGNSASIQNASPGAPGEDVVTAGMLDDINPLEEWKQIFTDSWRIQRDFFYDPNMHGVNWAAMREHYGKIVDDCITREEVGYVIGELIGELNVGHAYYGGGDFDPEPGMSVGMLGCDFELSNGAYKISKIYRGAAWDADARGPLTQAGIDVKEGDYLLAVNRIPVDPEKAPWASFLGTANRTIVLSVSSKPKMDDAARDVIVRPMQSDEFIRYRAWIEHNRAYVEKKTNGQVGYVYVPDTGINGQNDLVRQYFSQVTKGAIIVDERWNGGGQVPVRFIELLNRPVLNYFATRDGEPETFPPASHNGPKCMLINGLAGSGGDAFPSYFKQVGLGKLIGMRTWGGLVGLSGNPELIDGASMTVPRFGYYKLNGNWGIEGHGVDPDIEVVDDPAKMVDGGDPQLDAAINLMLDEAKKHPFVPTKKPVYPNRSGMGVLEKDR